MYRKLRQPFNHVTNLLQKTAQEEGYDLDLGQVKLIVSAAQTAIREQYRIRGWHAPSYSINKFVAMALALGQISENPKEYLKKYNIS